MFILSGLIGFIGYRAFCNTEKRVLHCANRHSSGNVFVTLFAAVALAGVLGVSYTTLVKSPVTNVSTLGQKNNTENEMMLAVRILVGATSAEQDCDADGTVEPLQWREGVNVPQGGGLIPLESGAPKTDGWKREYGYCVWDHGSKTKTDDVAECGGSSALRLVGGNVKTENILALISAGPNGVFETSCNDWLDADDDKVADNALINKPAGSDDIVHAMTMETLVASGILQLPDLLDSDCTPTSIGIMRYNNGTMQVCTENGWEEVGAAVTASAAFTNVTNAERSTIHTSNQISFTGFFGEKNAVVDNDAIIVVNGVEKGSSTKIKLGDLVSLRATSSSEFTTENYYVLRVGGLSVPWSITTRDPTPAAFTITPSTSSAMNIAVMSLPATGSVVTFLVTNTGETTSTAMKASVLSNTTNFEYYSGGGYSGDNCSGKTLVGGGTCTVDVRPKASAVGSYSATLTVSDNNAQVVANLSGTATLGCPIPWGGTINNGQSVLAYGTAATCGGSCPSSNRTCNNGDLGGNTSYTNQSCDNISMCTYNWAYGSWSSCSNLCGAGMQTRTVTCKRSDNATVNDSFCSGAGAKPPSSQACTGTTCYSWNTGSYGSCGGACDTGMSYNGTQTRTVTCRNGSGSTVSDSYCTTYVGAKPPTSQSCSCGCTATIGSYCVSAQQWNMGCHMNGTFSTPSGYTGCTCTSDQCAGAGTTSSTCKCYKTGGKYCKGLCNYDY